MLLIQPRRHGAGTGVLRNAGGSPGLRAGRPRRPARSHACAISRHPQVNERTAVDHRPAVNLARLARLALLAVPLALGGCAWIAVATAPDKVRQPPSAHARAVAEQFWTTLHEGRYDQIDAALEQHLQVLVKEPADALTLAHTGWLHAWRFSERARAAAAARSIEHAVLARRWFDEAVLLDPAEPRYLGFAASFTMVEASILKNEKQMRHGYYRMKDAVAMWPEFNLFTSGYTMSVNPAGSAPFREGLQQQWETLDRCFGEPVGRAAPDLRRFAALETRTGPKRACWNSWIAPHNWEGFFLNFGDLLARAGDLPNAKAMYEAARISTTYDGWPYRAVLERRLARLDALPTVLNSPPPGEPEWTSMVSSAFACMACHQESGSAAAPIDPSSIPDA
jgi:hypothetical protein